MQDMAADQIIAEVLKLYTEDFMINCIVEEANKLPKESRIPFNVIVKYFLDHTVGKPEVPLFDEDKLTRNGAKALLYHFGYLE